LSEQNYWAKSDLVRILVHLTQRYMWAIGITLQPLSVWGGKVIVMWNII
jgi:hypothetical protein